MSVIRLQLTARDPIVALDGRPFGAGQGNRMRGLGWPLPSVVAGSFRTALVKADPTLDFAGNMPERLMKIEVAGVFPTVANELYLPAPSDAVAEPTEDGMAIQRVHRVTPQPIGGCDFPNDLPLQPVMLSEEQAKRDFKPKPVPAWWPLTKYEDWLTTTQGDRPSDWFADAFLSAAIQETRDHVHLEAGTGAAAEGELFTTAGLNLTHLPRFGVHSNDEKLPFDKRFAEIRLSARVAWDDQQFAQLNNIDTWHPLGGERRLVHWKAGDPVNRWTCPDTVKSELTSATRIRMMLATPGIFREGWKPGWLNGQLEGSPPRTNIKLKLVGVRNDRCKAVSGWSLQPLRETGRPGPKPIRRMVPAGSVYFFEKIEGDAAALAERWLHSVSDDEQERRDGFGLALWGTW